MAASNNVASQIPVLAGFQFDSSSITEGVNLFRGNLAFPLKLLSLPSRNSLAFDVTAYYQSSVEPIVDGWNLTAQTDILGVGWGLPFDRIVVDPRQTGTRLDDAYYLISQGQTTPLVAIPDNWARGSLEAGLLAAAREGEVAPALRAALAALGIRLASAARLAAGKVPGSWRLDDPANERSFTLVARADGTLAVESGGEPFEVVANPFWQGVYYADYERWEITKDDGSVLTFGGSGTSIRPDQPPNVLSWGIQWNNWIGASTIAETQSRYVNAWNLASLESSVGNRIVFNYFVVEQAVGVGALTYTKECHVLEAQNDLGWTCSFAYQPMTYDNSSLSAPKEYLDPYHDPTLPPSTEPDAYQSAYNTHYLTTIEVANAEGAAQLALAFDYYPLQNVTAPGGPNQLGYGATYKRYLKSITQTFADGVARPPVSFEYLFTQDTSQNRGAMSKITYPSGGASYFTYQEISIGGDGETDPGARNLQIPNPFGTGTAAPRSWFGADYVVCGWYSEDQQQLLVNVFTWLGRWYQWQPTWTSFDGPIDLDALQVAASSNVFLLSIPRPSASTTDVYLFNRVHLANGEWQVDPGSPYSYSTLALSVVGGDDFFVVADSASSTIDRYSWNWMERGWDIDPVSAGGLLCQTTGGSYRYYLAAGLNYFLVMCYDAARKLSRFSLFYRDPLEQWQSGGTLDATDIDIAETGGLSYCALGPGGSFTALAWVTAFTPSGDDFTFDYSLRALTWDEDFGNLAFAALPSVSQEGFTALPSPILRAIGPVMVGNTLVGSGPNLFRWDGLQWSYQFLGVRYRGLSDASTQYYWYAYWSAAALVTENTSAGVYSALVSLDPSQPQLGWQTQVLTDLSGPVPDRETKYFPTLADAYLTQDTSVYGRSVYPSWLGIDNLLLTRLDGLGVDTTTMIDQAPFFTAFMTLDTGGQPNATNVLFFDNGDILRTPQNLPAIETLDGQQMFRMLDHQHHYKTALSGKLPAIPFGFITFPADESDDAASQITLHRYANQSVIGPINTWVLSILAVDSGYDRQVRCYDYQDLSASQDASGTIVRFHRVDVYQACTRPLDQRYGRTTSYFFNGLPPQATGMSSLALAGAETAGYSALDGMLIRQEQRSVDSTLITSVESSWDVAEQVATNAEGTQWRNLYGGIPQVVRSTKTIDGVLRTTAYTYSPSSGAPKIVVTSYIDSTGQQVTRQQTLTFAFEKYAEMWNRNLLKPVAQTVTYVQPAGGTSQVVGNLVETSKAWPRVGGGTYWADSESWIALSADAPPFTAWAGGDPGPLWKRSEKILTRAEYGQVTESIDVQDRHLSLLYDDEARVLVAQLVNASFADGIGYDGFEPYQESAWAFAPPAGGATFDGDSFTGAACFAMTRSGTLSRPISVASPTGSWVFALWYKTPPGSAPGAVAVSLAVASSGGRLTKALDPTGGEWANAQWVVDLDALGLAAPATLTLEIDVTVGAGLWVRVDDIWWTPQASQWSATVYDLDELWASATLGANAGCQRSLRNLDGGVAARSGVYENPVGITTTFYSLQAAAVFQPSRPNFTANFAGRDPGFLDELKDGALADYAFIDSTAADWAVADRRLELVGSSSAPLGARVRRQGFSAASLAAHVLVDATAANRVSLGTGTFFALWNGAQWQLVRLSGGNLVVLQASASVPFAREWLFALFDDRILFFAGGTLVFSYQDAAVAAGEHGVELGLASPAAFSELAVAQTLGLAINYSDGLSRPIQSVAMESGGATILTATLYDDRGLEAITIKPSRVTTAQVADPFAYYLGYVTNAAFGSALWSGGPMTGPAASVYHPESGGYPFTRKTFEAAPTARVVQLGKPGVDFAITAAGNPHVTTNAYGSNPDVGPFLYPLPASQYLLVTTTDADGNTTQTWSDTEEQRVGVIVKGTGLPAAGWITSMVFDPAGRPTASIPPSYFEERGALRPPGPIEIPPSATTAAFNYLGQRIEVANPDQGTSRCVYDYASQPRFMQDAAGAAQGFIRYVKYDVLNRAVEDGSYPMASWDPVFLQDKAYDDPAWPPATTTWNTRRAYDGDDTTPYLLGRLWQAFANNQQQTTADVTDTFTYDPLGGVLTKTRQLTAYTPETEYEIACTYDSIGALLTSRDSATGLTGAWTYDPLGKVIAIAGTAGGTTTDLLRLAYTQGGQIATADLLPTGGGQLARRTYSYDTPDWLLGEADPTFVEELAYTTGSCQGGGYFSGSVAHQTVEYQQGGGSPVDDCFTVDALNQIVGAGSGPGARSWAMDANGNVQTAVAGTVTRTYAYPAPGSNQLQSVTSSDGSLSRSYLYGPTGDVTTATAGSTTMQFAYAPPSGRLVSVTLPAASVAWAYDPSGLQTLQTTVDGATRQTFSFVGKGAVLQLPPSDLAGPVRYLTAPGIVVAFTGGAYYFGLLDHLGSTRTILAADGALVGELSYDLYGVPTVITQPPFPWAFYYTGQPWNPLLGLYQFPNRLYDPAVGRFLMCDPALQQPSPYVYAGNNPMMAVDPTGMIAWYWFVAAFTVGALVTVATGGLGAVAFGTGIGAAMAVGAVAGVLGTLASDGILALGGEHITAGRLLIDVLSGGAAGIVGAGVGGVLGRATARAALDAGWSVKSIVVASSLVSGISGGLAGGVTAGGVTAGLTGEPFFSKATALNILLGTVVGAGSGLMAAGVHLGWLTGPGSLRTAPVELTQAEFGGIQSRTASQHFNEPQLGAYDRRMLVLNPYQADDVMLRVGLDHNSRVTDIVDVMNDFTTVNYRGANYASDTVAVHGVGRYVMVEWMSPTGVRMNRPLSAENLALYLQGQGFGTGRPIRLITCFAALPGRFGSVAQTMANAFGQDVYAYWKVVYPENEPPWIRFSPR